MEWLVGLFSGDMRDLSRINGWGLVVLALGVALTALARRLAGEKDNLYFIYKIVGLMMVMLGAALTVRLLG